MKKLLTLFLFAAITLHSTRSYGQDKAWTLLVYMVGSDLESKSEAGTTDIAEMLAVSATDKVNIIVLTGGSDKEGWKTPIAWEISNGVKTQLSFTASTDNMAEPQLVTEYINFVTANYQAQSTALVFWNHGGDIRGYGVDENSKMLLSIPQLKSAIDSTNFIQNGSSFEILGFDACLMATLEVQSMLSPFAHYYIGSEETEPGHGWDYTPIIEEMQNGTSQSGDVVGKVVVNAYYNQAQNEGTSNVTLGLMDLKAIPNLESQLSILLQQIASNGKITAFHKARAKAEEYSKSINDPEYSEDMVDVGDLVKMIKKEIPEVGAQADVVLAALRSTVLFNLKDSTRPLATGISMYVPHNVFLNEDETYAILDNVYSGLTFSPEIKSFIKDAYVPMSLSDKTPPSGTIDPNFFIKNSKRFNNNTSRSLKSDSISALHVPNGDDIEQVRVMLVKDFEGFPNEYIMLGSTYPDTIAYYEDGSETYAYVWDAYWLSINGYPAYIKDIHQYEVEDSSGEVSHFTKIQIPAIQNPDTDNERYVILSYRYDQDFNITFESIVPETYNDSIMITAKERINLKPGEKIQLLYESFDRVTGEWFDVVNSGSVFEIKTGNEDLRLDYDPLFANTYHLGYVLSDYSQNDTLIFDEKMFSVLSTSTHDVVGQKLEMFPNPADAVLTLNLTDYANEACRIRLISAEGKVVHSSKQQGGVVEISTSRFPTGLYYVEVSVGKKIVTDKVLIQH